jgi:CelD/BcsL family acetyltransferase involved in cellulose biosynthesis
MSGETPVVEIAPVDDYTAVAPLWRDLERRSDGSFFQSWAWTGCLAEERFSEPWLLRAHDEGGAVRVLALFNRGKRLGLLDARAFLLGESGVDAQDSIFIEHNGLLLDRTARAELARACWEALSAKDRRASWILSGVAAQTSAALPPGRSARVRATRPAPFLDFSRLERPDLPLLDQLSANLRQQLRRSLRAWNAVGPLTCDIAATPAEADSFLDGLKALHQKYWTSRGRPGAFAEPFFERFHRALIRRAAPGQSIDLMRISAGGQIAGYLYNFVHHGAVAAYQSGFDFSGDAARLRPGLICHLLAIEHYRRAGMRCYDFLGGEARYKRGFSNAETELLWLRVTPKISAFPDRLKFFPKTAA